MSLSLPRQPQTDTFSCDLAAPESALATFPPLFARAFFAETSAAAAACGFREYDFQIALLRGDPALDEAGRVLGEVLVELALGVCLVEFLDQQGEVVVHADDGLEVGEVGP